MIPNFRGWNPFSVNKQESLVDILSRYSEDEVRKAIPVAFPGKHFSNNPPHKLPPHERPRCVETGGER